MTRDSDAAVEVGGALGDLLAERGLVVLVGEGGVGKTTCAAALAIAGARSGRRTAVLTVDPAPRLGDALGLGGLHEHPQRVPLSGTDTDASSGSLDAFRLDTERTFDRIVEALAPSRETARTVLAHPIYRAIAGSLGGSDAFMALQRLYEIDREASYDLLVVDTPPAVHARELLSAPSRLNALLETDAAKVLANPAAILARAGSRFARTSAALLLPILERATGLGLRRQVADFIEVFESVLVRLTERARDVEALLRSDRAAFVAVARPTQAGAAAAASLQRSLAVHGISIAAVVVNRVTPPAPAERRRALKTRVTGAPAGTIAAVRAMESDMDAQRAMEAAALADMRAELERSQIGVPLIELGALEHDVCDLDQLAALGRSLAPGSKKSA